MNITDVRVVKKEANQLRGFASIVIDDSLIVKNIKIIEGRDGLFIAMPSYKLKNGEFKDIVHPLNTETRTIIKDLILSKFNELDDPEESGAANISESHPSESNIDTDKEADPV